MVFTPKQERNGTDIGGDGHNSAVASAGPMVDVSGLMAQSVSAAASVADLVNVLFTSPAGAGVGGHEIGPTGPMFEWDSGLAVSDVEGGGSG